MIIPYRFHRRTRTWRGDPVSIRFTRSLREASGADRIGRALRVSAIDFRNDARVLTFLSGHRDALIYHHPAWLAALQEESGQRCSLLACESEDGSLCGIMPIGNTRGLPFNIANHQTKSRISSLPRTPFAGPLSTSREATELLLTAAIERAEAEDCQLQIKTNSVLEGNHPELVRTEWRPTYVLTLPEPRDPLNFGDAKTRHNLRWGVKKAGRLGLAVRPAETESELKAWYVLYLTTMRRNFVPPRSYRFFLFLWHELKDSRLVRLLLAEHRTAGDAKLVAGSFFLMMGQTVFYAFTGCLPQHLSTHANDLILWDAIHQAHRDGYRFFDFGEVPEERPDLARYKAKWGSVPKPLYRYYDPRFERSAPVNQPRWLKQALMRTWRHVPLSMTARVGEWLYSYL